jgi:hypothetical protein
MSDVLAVMPIIGVKITFKEFCDVDQIETDLKGFMAGVNESSKKFKGYYLGKELCELDFPAEYSAEFEIGKIAETLMAVKTELEKMGIMREPEFVLIEYMA